MLHAPQNTDDKTINTEVKTDNAVDADITRVKPDESHIIAHNAEPTDADARNSITIPMQDVWPEYNMKPVKPTRCNS